MHRGELAEPKPGQERDRERHRVPHGGGGGKRNLSILALVLGNSSRRRHHAGGRGSPGCSPAQGSLGSPRAISETLRETTPLLIAGVAVFPRLAGRALQYWGRGPSSRSGRACAPSLSCTCGPVGFMLGILAGAVAGALWACPQGLIKAYRGRPRR